MAKHKIKLSAGGKYYIINDKFIIEKEGGAIWYHPDFIGIRKDFPKYVFEIRDKLAKRNKIKFKYL